MGTNRGRDGMVEIFPRRNSRPVCSGCGRAGPGYDTLEARVEFVPRFPVFRVSDAACGLHWREGRIGALGRG